MSEREYKDMWTHGFEAGIEAVLAIALGIYEYQGTIDYYELKRVIDEQMEDRTIYE